MVRLPQNKKQTYRLNSKPQMWPSYLTMAMTLTLNFQGQICNLLYLCQKWSDCHETKNNLIDRTLSLRCDHQIWPSVWPWHWIFKVKYGIHSILAKNGPIATKQEANISIEIYASNVTTGFDGHVDWTEGHSDHQVWPWPWPWKGRCKDLPDSNRGDFRCRCAVDSTSFD